MTTRATISIDAMGGDHGPSVVVEGVALLARRRPDAARYLLHGRESEIAPLLEAHPDAAAVCEIRHSDTHVTMSDKPSEALRRSRGSSMWNAITAVRDGEATAAVSAGNTGALMAISKVLLRTMKNVHRPAIAASWPTIEGYCVVLDVGATVEAQPRQLVEFAIMGAAFHRAVHASSQPRVGLLNVGAEDVKGNDTVRQADELIRHAKLDLNYIGYVEGNDISLGASDVVVTDGFTGNVALKTAEGTARLVAAWVREALTSDLRAKLGALLSAHALKQLRARMDPNNVNGGVFLGLNGAVVKSHGGADADGFASALGVALDIARSDFQNQVSANLDQLEERADAAQDGPAPQPAEAAS